jgi:hypothetical protein
MAGLVDNPEYWRGRAEETRTLADAMKDETSKKIMRGIAEDYERMAKRAVERRKEKKRSRSSLFSARGTRRIVPTSERSREAPRMDRTVAHLNIEHYRKLLPQWTHP